MCTLKICKDRHKFSSSHFTIFSKDSAEALHGHNYYVSLEIEGETLNDQELLIDVVDLKNSLSKILKNWDEKILLPLHSKHLKIKEKGPNEEHSTEVLFSNRRYIFPSSEVECLNLKNVTMEALAFLISEELQHELKSFSYRVVVKESQGQEASYYCKGS